MAAESSPQPGDASTPAKAPSNHQPAPDITDMGRFFFGPHSVASTAVCGVFVLGLIAFLYFAKAFLMPLILALLLSFLLKPIVAALCVRGIHRGVGAAVVLLLFFALISTAIYRLNQPAREWLSKVPESVQLLESKGRELLNSAERFIKRGRASAQPFPERTDAEKEKAESKRLAWAEKLVSVGAIVGYTAGFLVGSLEMFVLLYFLLAAGDKFLQKLVRILPRMHDKKEAVEIAREVEQNISTFLFTITIVNSCVGLVVAVVMLMLGMPNPVLWGVVAGLFNFIPYFGPLSVVLVLMLAGFLSFDSTLGAMAPSMIYLAIHTIESNFITPAILGRRLTLNPVVIFISLMFWTWLWGMPGALLAVPLLMTFKIFCDHLRPLASIGEFLSE